MHLQGVSKRSTTHLKYIFTVLKSTSQCSNLHSQCPNLSSQCSNLPSQCWNLPSQCWNLPSQCSNLSTQCWKLLVRTSWITIFQCIWNKSTMTHPRFTITMPQKETAYLKTWSRGCGIFQTTPGPGEPEGLGHQRAGHHKPAHTAPHQGSG